MATTYDELVRLCTNGSTGPYDYQRRIAAEGLPELLNIPTGAGKTMAVVLGWLYRRRFHPDLAVRAATPHWLVICQPMRTLVEQVRKNAETWLNAAGLADDVDPVNLFVFMEGEPTAENDWRLQVHQDAIIVGTQDMLLSRALNRGFGSSRFLWPVEFGVLNTGCHWVFDEVQLMGAGVPTGRQLAAFRAAFPALLPQGSTWMSATVDRGALATIDNPTIVTDFGLSEADRTGPLHKRLTAPKLVSEIALAVDAKRGRQLAARVVEEHRPGTLTLAIVNTVADAQAVHEAVVKAAPVAEVILLHSRFRRGDRARLVERLIAPIGADSPGRICISTQVVEAGMDLDAAIVFTEAAPWSSIVQRFGRCNRAGTTDDAKALWFAPAKPDKPRPYEAEDVAEATDALRSLEGQTVQADGLAEQGPAPRRPLHSVLRRRDLDNLFDTMPDISGADVDVTPFVRDLDDDRTVHIAWRDLGTDLSGERASNQAELSAGPACDELRLLRAGATLLEDAGALTDGAGALGATAAGGGACTGALGVTRTATGADGGTTCAPEAT